MPDEILQSPPVGDVNVIRALQGVLELARVGKIVGVSMIGLTPDGGVMESNALPPNPTAMFIAIGALTSQIATLTNMVKTYTQKQALSPIIRPR